MKGIDIKEIAEFIGGEVIGENDLISNVAKIEEAKKGDITFVSNQKYLKFLKNTKASAVIVDSSIELKGSYSITLITTSNPYFAICMIMDKFFNKINHPTGISNHSHISEKVDIGENCSVGSFTTISNNVVLGNNVIIYPNCFIGENVTIKSDTILYPNVSVYRDTIVGENCIIHSGVVIGSDGFGHAPLPDGSYAKIPQIGNVIIGDNVEIGANTVIDRATMGSTIIEDGVKLDNLIQIAHNAKVGKNTVIAAQTGLSGSTELGERCIIGGQVGFVGHIKVANNTQIGAQSGIMKGIKKEGQAFLGSPIKLLRDEIKSQVIIRKLPEIYSDLQQLKKEQKSNK